MIKQEILDEINKTKEHLANMEKMLEECEYGRWKPKINEDYWFVSAILYPTWTLMIKNNADEDRYNTYNCFKTEQEAKVEAEKILVRRQLEDIAKRLNKGKQITWSTVGAKYFLLIDCDGKIATDFNSCITIQGVVYCFDRAFKDVAIQEIGEDRLKKYLRGE